MQAKELTFGVEIETSVSIHSPFQVGGYHSGHKIRVQDIGDDRYAPLEGWGVERDGSIACRSDGRNPQQPCEFISPVLKGDEGQQNLYNAIKCIKQVAGASVNSSCGVHVHVGFPRNPEALKRLTHLVAAHEKAFFAVTGTPRREQTRYCRGIQDEYSPRIAFNTNEVGGLRCNVSSVREDRYRILNLAPMLHGSRRTVEFRCFSGSIRPERILAWVRLCLAVCELAIEADRACKWVHKDNAVANKRADKTRNSNGFIALRVLLYKIGWTRGRSYVRQGWDENGKVVYQRDENGKLIHRTFGGSLDGVAGIPKMTEGRNNSRQVLKQLANKYDEKIATRSL